MKKNTTKTPVQAPAPVAAAPVALSFASLPTVKKGHLVSLVTLYVKPHMIGNELSPGASKKARQGIELASGSNPFLLKCLIHAEQSASYGSLFKLTASGTDTRGTFKGLKDKSAYLNGDLKDIEPLSLEVGTFTFTPTSKVPA